MQTIAQIEEQLTDIIEERACVSAQETGCIQLESREISMKQRSCKCQSSGGDLFCSFSPTVADELFLCNTAE